MQYDLFVFAGQSNMMGACVLPPKHLLSVKRCLEYRYNPVHRGNANGSFVPVSYDTGEFLYHDPKAAYQNTDETGNSRLCDYEKTLILCRLCRIWTAARKRLSNRFPPIRKAKEIRQQALFRTFVRNGSGSEKLHLWLILQRAEFLPIIFSLKK